MLERTRAGQSIVAVGSIKKRSGRDTQERHARDKHICGALPSVLTIQFRWVGPESGTYAGRNVKNMSTALLVNLQIMADPEGVGNGYYLHDAEERGDQSPLVSRVVSEESETWGRLVQARTTRPGSL